MLTSLRYSFVLFGITILSFLSSCTSQEYNEKLNPQEIINKSIQVHGGNAFDNSFVQFDFRKKQYTVKRSHGKYQYIREFQDTSSTIRDVLTNDGFQRLVDGQPVTLSNKRRNAYTNSVNSVLYFVQLPYGLNDAAVIKKYKGEAIIKGKNYHKIQITFKQEGGGEDFQDVFLYWINKESHTLDYLAYSYETDGGGIRFREAINPRQVEGMRFVDYVNYKPAMAETNLANIDQAFNEGKLVELSRIINENVTVEKL